MVLIGMAAVSLILVVRSFSQLRGFDPHFFFLGAGFLLMETKSVTEFALLVGSTWRTNALVFAVILLVVYLANMAVIKERLRIPQRSGYAVIFFILALQWLSFGRLGGLPTPVQVGLAALLLGGAVFMSAVVFARSFSRVTLASTALAANLVGSVLGGALEYSSLAFGLRASTILAAAMYGLSWLSLGVRASPARLSA